MPVVILIIESLANESNCSELPEWPTQTVPMASPIGYGQLGNIITDGQVWCGRLNFA